MRQKATIGEGSGIDLIAQDMINYFFDTSDDRVNLKFSQIRLYVSAQDKIIPIFNYEDIINYIKNNDDKELLTIVNFEFSVYPDIIVNKFLDIRDIIFDFIELYREIDKLREYKTIIDVYNSEIYNEIEKEINKMIRNTTDNLININGNNITIASIQSSNDIFKTLLNFFFKYDDQLKGYKKLISHCEVLDSIQKEMFINSLN